MLLVYNTQSKIVQNKHQMRRVQLRITTLFTRDYGREENFPTAARVVSQCT